MASDIIDTSDNSKNRRDVPVREHPGGWFILFPDECDISSPGRRLGYPAQFSLEFARPAGPRDCTAGPYTQTDRR